MFEISWSTPLAEIFWKSWMIYHFKSENVMFILRNANIFQKGFCFLNLKILDF